MFESLRAQPQWRRRRLVGGSWCSGADSRCLASLACLGMLFLFTRHSFLWYVVVYQIYNLANSPTTNLQPTIDKDSQETLTSECPRIVVNPKPSLLGYRGTEVPREAVMHLALDDAIVEDIDPKTWAVSGCKPSRTPLLPAASPNELSIAEKFRLAFLDRDTRLAPKRAKNTRQHQRRAEREWVTTDMKAKALVLASKANKSMNHRNLWARTCGSKVSLDDFCPTWGYIGL